MFWYSSGLKIMTVSSAIIEHSENREVNAKRTA